jgi:hypothetical protein
MGYLNKASVTVDAILTKKGRELLARGRSAFNITRFSVADDEIDYSLFDPAHPLGTEYYGSAIESMPIVEASPDETQNLRYKLVTFSRGRNTIPLLRSLPESIELTYSSTSDGSVPIEPSTVESLNDELGYTAILYDGDAAIITGTGLNGTGGTVPNFGYVSENAAVVTGRTFRITPRNVVTQTYTQLTIVGNVTGATKTITVIVNPEPTV